MKHATTQQPRRGGAAAQRPTGRGASASDHATGIELGRDRPPLNAAESFATWRADVTALLAVLDAELDIRERRTMHNPEDWSNAYAVSRIRAQLIRTLIDIGGLTQVDIDDLLGETN